MKQCPICDKVASTGGKRSNRVRATQYNPTDTRVRKPNLQWAKLASGKRIKVCAKCLKKGKHLKA